jgi:multidrug efflux pump subunit AcrB
MWEIPGVDHVYSMSGAGYVMVTVRFVVGEDQEESVSKVHAKLFAALDAMPAGVQPPIVKPHSIDDVPILALTLHSLAYGSNELRRIAATLAEEIRTLPDVAGTSIIGGQSEQIRVEIDPARLAASGVTPGEVAQALAGANARMQAGEYASADRVFRVDVGAPLANAGDVGDVVITARAGSVVRIRDVADVREDFGERVDYGGALIA